MDKVTLVAKKRDQVGSGPSKRIRREGMVPATLYGHGMNPLSLQVSTKEFTHILHTKSGENTLIDLNVEDVKLKESTCLIKAVQHHPVSDDVEHIDFTVVSMTEKIEVNVHLAVKKQEEAPGVKEGGVLDVVHHEIEITCLPTQIPESIEVTVKEMNIGDAIHIKDLQFPEGVTPLLDPEEVVIALHPPTKEEEPAPEGEEGVAEGPEVIEKGKKAAEGEEGEEAAPAEAKPEKKE